MNSVGIDKAVAKSDLDRTPKFKKRHHDDQDPLSDSEKEEKKKRRKDINASKSQKDKNPTKSSKEDKAPYDHSKTGKTVNAEESVQDDAMDAEESIEDDIVDAQELTQDDDVTEVDRSKWFKQVAVERPKNPDPEWFKEPNVNDALEQNWFNEMVNTEKDLKESDNLMGSTIDFTKFTNNCLKKDKLSKADLEGPAFALLKGNFKNNIELEYNMEQYLEYLKTGNKEKKYVVSLTKPKAARRADQKEYRFNETNFSRLHLNDIEDITVIKKRVEKGQLGVESYETKLNITFPQFKCDGLEIKEPYTILYKPRGVVYKNTDNCEILVRDNELYKFSDGTLKSVHDNRDLMLHNFKLGYNNQGMPNQD
ncbi:hypothetical protein Tco_0252875 [Tanacetum coccineum]